MKKLGKGRKAKRYDPLPEKYESRDTEPEVTEKMGLLDKVVKTAIKNGLLMF